MKKYSFEQFNTEIINPTITLDEDSVKTTPSKLTFECSVVLQVENAKCRVFLYNMPYTGILTNNERDLAIQAAIDKNLI